jgi:hypothetical protein
MSGVASLRAATVCILYKMQGDVGTRPKYGVSYVKYPSISARHNVAIGNPPSSHIFRESRCIFCFECYSCFSWLAPCVLC